ncbi:MAG: hypothetical protein O9335_16435 [Inhella sp.]|nr:hypothetical protein [Inhella sp.]MCZ8236738.1 hypothetical protein [Inhella sp.]
MNRVIHIHPAAPAKPVLGAACNGCGLCCLWAPCPVGVWASRRRSGACAALEWDEAESRYRCGVLRAPTQHLLGSQWPRWDRWLRPWVQRQIAAGQGCDAALEATRP